MNSILAYAARQASPLLLYNLIAHDREFLIMPVGSGLVFVNIAVSVKHDVNDWDFRISDGFDYTLCTVSSYSRDRVD